jgi:hypothetical protein
MRHRAPRIVRTVADLCVYAPIGFLFEAPHLVPKLIETGRERLHRPAPEPRREVDWRRRRAGAPADRRVTRPRAPLTSAEDELAMDHGATGTDAATPGDTGPSAAPSSDVAVDHPVIGPAGERADVTTAPGPELPIPGYDQLAASQVVARLGDLDPTALLIVEAYEAEHRQRRTILNRIAQLRGS